MKTSEAVQTKKVSTLTSVLLVAGVVGMSAWGAVQASQGLWFGWSIFGSGIIVTSGWAVSPPQTLWVMGFNIERLLQLAGILMLCGSLAFIAGFGG